MSGNMISEDKISHIQHCIKVMAITPRTGSIDIGETISLVSSAKGSRNLSEFSLEIDESISKISRILSGKTAKLSNSTIAKIVFSASPESGVTLEKMMKAQGFSEFEPARKAIAKHTDSCRKIIVDSLLNNGYEISYVPIKQPDNVDFILLVKGKYNDNMWKFDCVYNNPKSHYDYTTVKNRLYRIMSSYYLGEKCGRYSLVLADERAFKKMKKELSEYRIPDEISLILISLESEEIKEEFIIPINDNKEAVSIFPKQRVDRLP